MGCWNHTCSISKLPIRWNEEIVLIPLITKEIPSASLGYYVTDNYNVFGLPLYGKYDDYGGIEDIEDPENNMEFYKSVEIFEASNDNDMDKELLEKVLDKATIKTFSYMLSPYLELINKELVLVPDDKKEFNELINDFLSDDSYIIHPKDGRKNKYYYTFDYMMIHKELYNRLINHIGEQVGADRSRPEKTMKELWYERLGLVVKRTKLMREFIDKKIENTKKDKEAEVLRDLYIFDLKYNTPGELLKIGDMTDTLITYDYFIEKLSRNWDENLANEIVNMILFKYALASLRMGYNITSGAGSQNYNELTHTIVAEYVLEHARQTIENYKKDNELEEEETEESLIMEKYYWYKDTNDTLKKDIERLS